jgi:hypothetical protein
LLQIVPLLLDFLELEMEIRLTCSKIISFQSFLVMSVVFSNCGKVFPNLDSKKGLLEEEEE